MSESAEQPSTCDAALSLDTLVADFLSKNASILDIMRPAPRGDYWAFVQQMRLFHVLSSDSRGLDRLRKELCQGVVKLGGDPYDGAIERELARKDGPRRFDRLTKERAQMFNQQPSLLSGATFEVCLEQYKSLIAHVERTWSAACQLYALGNYPLATFLSILVIEEVGKLSRLVHDLMFYDVPRVAAQDRAIERSHRRKHFVSVVSGALINARLDRVLGKDVVRRILHQAESDELEKTRQSCLYVDVRDGRAMTPSEIIDAERARVLTVLAGELMAEVLGHFPWEFDRMIENVIAFERSIGMPEKMVRSR